MVFESIVADLINRFLGEYVENLDRKQLKIGLFGGDIVLNDLIIKHTVLNELDLPITVTYARLGKLILKIPYTEIYKAPVVAIVERLYLLAVPNNSIVYDAEKEKNQLNEAKKNEILKIEKAKLDQEEKDKPKMEKGFAEKLVAQIINNIQIKINDVHIRYEDRYTINTPFAFGITLSKLSVHTTNDNWIEEIVQASVTKIFKVAQLEGLAVYLNHDAKLFQSEDISKYPTLFKESIASKTEWPSDYNYIFGPISLLTKLQLNPKPEDDDDPYTIPKIKLGIKMEKLRLGISREQYKYMTQLIEVMGRMVRGTPYRKFRPVGIPYRGNYARWWKFAYECVLEVEVRRRRKNWNWEHIIDHRNSCRSYAEVYRTKLTSKKPSADILKQCEEFEMKLDLYNILIIRQKIELEVEKLGKLEKEQPKKGWFSWWGGKDTETKANDDTDDIKKKFEAAMTNEEKAKLYDAIGYQENFTPTEEPEHFIGTDITFELDALEVIVRDELSNNDLGELFEEILFLQLKGVICNLQQRSAASALRCGVQMDEFRIEGVKQDGEKPLIVTSNIVDSSGVLLDIIFETNPIDKKCDQRIKISSKPIQIVYDAKTIIQLIKIFQTPKTTTISQLQDAAAEKLINIKERSATGLQYAISKHTRLELDIAFMPSYLIVPYGGAYKRQESVLVLSLGKLIVRTEPRQENDTDIRSMHQAGAKQEEIMAEIISRSYDKFSFEIQDVQAIVAKPDENWLISITNCIETKMHLLQPTSLKVLVCLCVIDDDPRLPKSKIAGELSSIHVCVTQNRIMELISILTSIPLPESDNVTPPPLKDSNRFGSSISLLKYLDDRQKNVNVPVPETVYETDETEVTQFTDIEISFVLNEFSLTICNNEVSTSKSSSDVFVTPTEIPTTPVTDALSQGGLSFDYTLPFQKNKMLSCKVKQLEISLVQRTYDLKIDLKLGAIAVDQYRRCNDTETVLNIINTPKYDKNSDYLFILNYINCKRSSPEFITKYGSVEQLLEINFSTLLVLLHQEGINELLEILSDIQTKVDILLKANSENKNRIAQASEEPIPTAILQHVTKGKLPAILEDDSAKHQSTSKPSPPVVDSIKFKVIAKLEDVAVELQNETRSIAILEIQNLQAGVSIKSSYTDIKLKLQDIIVTDRNPDAVHSKILSIVGDNALSCELVLFNLDATSSYNSDNMNITITMGCAKIVFLNLFVSSVLDFLDNFQAAQQKIKDASVYGLEAAKTNVVEAYSQATRMKLNIKIKAPLVIVPVDSKTVEALAVDLGFLSITNKCTDVVTNHDLSPAVIDIMKVELTDMKLSKVIVRASDDLGHSRFGGDELSYGIQSDAQILCPTSFTLILKRNLSASWYKEQAEIDISGRIDSIELNVASSDYIMMMSILSRNMTETAVTKKNVHVTTPSAPPKIEHQTSIRHKTLSTDKSIDAPSESTGSHSTHSQDKMIVDTFLKFSFQLNSIKINLFTAPNEGLATFGLYYISLKGQKLVDNNLTTSIVLCDVHLDDTRSNRQNKITKFMHRRDPADTSSDDPVRSMIDVTLNIKENDMFADVKIFSFNLILSIDFLMKISNFFQTDTDKAGDVKSVANKNKQVQAVQSAPVPKQENNSQMTLLLHIEQPDIILVERMDDLNCYALILNNEVSVKVRQVGDKQVIKGEIQNFCLYLSEFSLDARSTAKNYIIDPCSITLNGSMPYDEQMNISILTSDIKVSVSPSTIELLSNIVHTMTTAENLVSETTLPLPDLKDIWNEETFENEDFWFTRVDEPEEAMAAEFALVHNTKSESCIIQVPSLVIIIETGVGVHTIPMLFVEANMEAKIKNWSSEISVDGTLRLGISYYNNKMALWEPLLEPIEHELPSGETDYQLWELNFEMNVDSNQDKDDMDESNSLTKMKISSVNTLELTVTNTSLEVLQNLSKAFSDAMKPAGIAKLEPEAPYVVVNDTGEHITLDLKKSGFVLYTTRDESHDDETIDIGPNTRAHLQPEVETNVLESFFLSKSKKQSKAQERFMYVKIGEMEKEICLPVYKADYRYFPLYRDSNQEPWAIVSEVKINLDSIHVTLRSIVQVHNHFTAPISIYCIDNSQYREIAEVLPNGRHNVPLSAVYLQKRELYFSMQGYKPSAQGISWKEGSSNFNLSKSLQCDPLNTYEPFFINAIRERQEVFHEVTTRHTMLSASYIIHLRPTLTLKNCLPIGIQVCVLGCSVAREIELDSPSANQSAPGQDYLDYGIKEVKPGEILHLPTIKTSSKPKDNQTYIVVKLTQYLEKDWSCTTEVPSEPVDFVVWTFNSYDSVEIVSLQLGVRCENKNSGMMLTLYCPFWFINKTGLLLNYRASDETTNVLYHPAKLNQPVLFSFKEKSFYGKKKATIRVGNGDWCEKFSLDTAGSNGVIACKTNDVTYQIAVHNTLTHNSLTKQIVFMPYYVIINSAPFTIEVQEHQRPADPWIKVKPNDCVALWPKAETQVLHVKTEDTPEITHPFKYTDVQCTLLKLNNKYGGINVDVHVTEGAVYITFTNYHHGDAPALLINHTEKPITFWEKGNVNKRSLNPKSKLLYTWHDPAGDRVLLWAHGTKHMDNDLRKDGIGKFKYENTDEELWWISFLDGTQRVLFFSNNDSVAQGTQATNRFNQVTQEISVAIHGIGLSLVNSVAQKDVMYVGIASSGVIWEEKKKSRFKSMKIHESQVLEQKYQEFLDDEITGKAEYGFVPVEGKLEVNFRTMRIKKSSEREIRRTFYPGLWVEMKTSPYQLQLHAKINRIQIDNQLSDCIYPVVLAPVPPPRSVATSMELKPFIEMSVVQRIIPHSTVKQFKYLHVLMQEFHIKVDLIFINELFELMSSESTEEEAKELFIADLDVQNQPLLAHVTVQTQQEQKNFYDNLHLGPLKIHVSFSMAGSESSALPGILSTILQGVGVTLTDINDVVFRLAFFQREFQFLTQRQLISECVSHYTGQALKQVYVLVLGLDVIGNPYGLVLGFTKGFEDLFYEPFQGAIQGPGEFAEGLVVGIRSLFGHTVGGAAGAVSKITGAVGKGLAALTFDKDYQKSRRDALNKKPENLQEGIARSGKGLVMGVFDGVTGVFTKPISGAKHEGVEGFFKGLGKGAVGLVARPTAGFVDFASGSFDAVKRATDISGETMRLRPPRFLHSDNVLKPYSRKEAEGNKLLREVDKGKFAATDTFKNYEIIYDNKEAILLTDHRLIYTVKNDLFGGWQSEWSYQWNSFSSVTECDRGIELTLSQQKSSKSKLKQMFSNSEVGKKIIFVGSLEKRTRLVAIINQLITSYTSP